MNECKHVKNVETKIAIQSFILFSLSNITQPPHVAPSPQEQT